jgi:hypothetical protein
LGYRERIGRSVAGVLATTPSTRGIKLLFAAVALTFVVLIGTFVADLVTKPPAREVDRIALDDVPEGPSLQRAGDRAVVVVRDDDEITAYAAALPGGDPLVWCAADGSFSTALDATRYSIDGERLGGPGPDDLLRLDTAIVDGELEIAAVYPFDWSRTPWTSNAARTFEDFTENVC